MERPTLDFFITRWKLAGYEKGQIGEIAEWNIVEYDGHLLELGMTGNAIATRIKDEDILQLINQIINLAKADGKLKKIQDYWFDKADNLTDEKLRNLLEIKRLILQPMPKENPKLISRSWEFGTSLGYPFKKGDSLTLNGNIKYAERWPFSYELRKPFGLVYVPRYGGIIPNETGFGLSITEGSKIDNTSLSLNREITFGPILRWTAESFWIFKESFFGVHINATYTVKDSAEKNKVDNSFTETSDRRWKARVTFPEIGTNFPITDTVSIVPTVSYENFLTPERRIDVTINLKVTFP
ncbi:MAG: hypothetical protein AABZ05_07930 [Nitrospirota bacterium]|mgnify:CR=1 FL=1